MTIECYNVSCKKHDNHQGGEGPFCYEEECQFEPYIPAGHTEEELEKDNPYNQWIRE